jgi:hypothetical protein
MIEPHYAIFVMSSDKTADIARHFVVAFENHVSNIDCPVFWGTNSTDPGFDHSAVTLLRSPVSAWKSETIAQLTTLRRNHPQISHVLVFLDDFIITADVELESLRPLLEDAVRKEVKYLRLGRIEEAAATRLFQMTTRRERIGGTECSMIRRTHPYYSSLQVAFWDVAYLSECVSRADSIWSFENRADETPHYAVINPVIRYRHVVEKGMWDYGAAELCMKHAGFFEPGTRARRTARRGRIGRRLRFFWFTLFGYSGMRVKGFLRRGLGSTRNRLRITRQRAGAHADV